MLPLQERKCACWKGSKLATIVHNVARFTALALAVAAISCLQGEYYYYNKAMRFAVCSSRQHNMNPSAFPYQYSTFNRHAAGAAPPQEDCPDYTRTHPHIQVKYDGVGDCIFGKGHSSTCHSVTLSSVAVICTVVACWLCEIFRLCYRSKKRTILPNHEMPNFIGCAALFLEILAVVALAIVCFAMTHSARVAHDDNLEKGRQLQCAAIEPIKIDDFTAGLYRSPPSACIEEKYMERYYWWVNSPGQPTRMEEKIALLTMATGMTLVAVAFAVLWRACNQYQRSKASSDFASVQYSNVSQVEDEDPL